jgi:Ser-tRNA(Ala) deacylase AlaX
MHMAVQKIFWDDPYLTEIETRIQSVNGNIITVDRTIAYAFAGGQQSDSGVIGGYDILDARKDDKEIYYTIAPEHILNVDDIVIMRIDWDKRYRIMRLHFAAELVLELIYKTFNQPQKIGANITEEKARVDFFWVGNISEVFPFLYESLSKLIEEDIDIVSDFSNEESERRYWEIEGFAKVECGGTHIKKTSELSNLKLKRINIGGGKERIEIYLVD